MNGQEPESIPAPSAPPRGDSNKEEWSLRSCGEDAMVQSAGSDVELVPDIRGVRTSSLECSMEHIAREHCSKEDVISQTKEASSPPHSGTLEKVATGNSSLSLEPDVSWILNRASSVQSSANLGRDAPAEHNKDIARPCLSTSPGIRNDPIIISSSDHDVDSKTAHVSSTVGYNPFHPYKKLGPVKHADASECGSTTGPLEESEPLKKWKQMKENGFLSLSHGGIPLPKQQARQARKRRRDASKKKKSPMIEHVSRFTKFTAPSGLLSGLDPGIIKHVRNSKQVHSIIEAMVRSEKYDGQIQNKFPGPPGSEGTKETHLQRKYQNYTLDSAANQSALSPEKTSVPLIPVVERRFHYGACTSQFTSDNDTLALKLPSDVTMGSDNVPL